MGGGRVEGGKGNEWVTAYYSELVVKVEVEWPLGLGVNLITEEISKEPVELKMVIQILIL